MGLKRVITVASIVAACLLSLGRGNARADLIVGLQSAAPTGSGSQFQFEYVIQLASREGELHSIGIGPPVEFVTLYDIPYFVSSEISLLPGFEFLNPDISAQLVGMTPPNVFISDDPSLLNISISFPNTTANYGVSGGTVVSIASLSVYSMASALDPTGQFAGLSQLALIGDSFVTNQGFTPIPAAPVPEPATLLLVVTGGACAAARKRRAHHNERNEAA